MYISSHGGECCGLHHLVDFPIYPNHRDIDKFFQLTKPYQSEGNQRKIALECILRNDQLRSGWAPILKEETMKYFQNIHPHGGECCGITHIFGLNNIREATTEMISSDLNRAMTRCQEEMIENDANFNIIHTHLYEIVLTTYQLTEVMKNALDLSGFVEVNRFVNGNSGNTCVVFHCLNEQYMEDPHDD